ncbi:MAG: hypothetical protein ACTSPQ_22200 [Candidatus Helarchaeota archaeon]
MFNLRPELAGTTQFGRYSGVGSPVPTPTKHLKSVSFLTTCNPG